MKLLNTKELTENPMTVAQLRKAVRQRRNELNVRLMDENNEQNLRNAQNIIKSGNIRNDKVYSNKPIEYMNKKELIQAYNQYTTVINADDTSRYYHEYITQKDKEQLRKFNKSRREQGSRELNMQQFQEYIKIKEEFPELFKDKNFYLEVVSNVKVLRQKHQKPLLELMKQAKDELIKSGESWTNSDIIPKAMELTNLPQYQVQNINPFTGELY